MNTRNHESSPKPAEAIAREFVGRYCDPKTERDALHLVRQFLESAAAIQRGDGQTLHSMSEIPKKWPVLLVVHSGLVYEVVSMEHYLTTLGQVDSLIGWKTPPSETSGATPEETMEAVWDILHGGTGGKNTSLLANLCRARMHEMRELNTVRAAGAEARRVATEWRRMLNHPYCGTPLIYETTPELRDSLTELSRAVKPDSKGVTP